MTWLTYDLTLASVWESYGERPNVTGEGKYMRYTFIYDVYVLCVGKKERNVSPAQSAPLFTAGLIIFVFFATHSTTH